MHHKFMNIASKTSSGILWSFQACPLSFPPARLHVTCDHVTVYPPVVGWLFWSGRYQVADQSLSQGSHRCQWTPASWMHRKHLVPDLPPVQLLWPRGTVTIAFFSCLENTLGGRCIWGKAYIAPCTTLHVNPSIEFKVSATSFARLARLARVPSFWASHDS